LSGVALLNGIVGTHGAGVPNASMVFYSCRVKGLGVFWLIDLMLLTLYSFDSFCFALMASHFSLHAQRKVTKRKGTPTSLPLRVPSPFAFAYGPS